MPTLRHAIPRYTRYKKRFARMRLGGQDVHLGLYDSPESLAEFNRRVAEWMAQQRVALPATKEVVRVSHVIKRFAQHLKTLYKSKSGRDTGTRETYRPVLKLLGELYGLTPAEDFGPLALKAIRLKMVERGNGRKYINEGAAKIIAAFRFAASEQMISDAIYRKLESVDNLKPRETAAAEPRKITPVSDEVFEKTLAHCSPPVAAMARVQRYTGMRPGEVTQMRPMDIDRTGDIWFYTPREHKTEHHGITRVIAIGPKAQAALLRFLLRDADAECFSPREAQDKAESVRKTRYCKDSYARAITRACEEAFNMPKELRRAPLATGIRKARETAEAKAARIAGAKAWRKAHCWHPNQLRHSAATEIRAKFGLEAAKSALGHTKTDMTEVYAEKDLQKAAEVARLIG
jgi:integrase